jgi:protein SCO1
MEHRAMHQRFGSRLARLLAALAAIAWVAANTAVAQSAEGTSAKAFELVDADDRPFSGKTLAGVPYAIFFGFTHCPDVCPTTLTEMSNLLARLGPDADRLKIVFVTVDPERDTPAKLKTYLASFDARIIGLTGSNEQIAAAAAIWSAFYTRLPESDGSYTIVHSAYVYLVDRKGRSAGTMGFNDPEAEQLQKLKALLAD